MRGGDKRPCRDDRRELAGGQAVVVVELDVAAGGVQPHRRDVDARAAGREQVPELVRDDRQRVDRGDAQPGRDSPAEPGRELPLEHLERTARLERARASSVESNVGMRTRRVSATWRPAKKPSSEHHREERLRDVQRDARDRRVLQALDASGDERAQGYAADRSAAARPTPTTRAVPVSASNARRTRPWRRTSPARATAYRVARSARSA